MPPATTIDSRIKTIIYNPNEVFDLTFHYSFQSFIELNEDEEIEIISLGESFPWKITPVGKRIFIRALQVNISTNMTIITTKRVYQFQLNSDVYDGRGDEELIYSVRFFYPDVTRNVLAQNKNKYDKKTKVNETGTENIESMGLLNLKKGAILNFDYSMTGNKNTDIIPLKVFDDGISTYFQFSKNNTIVPLLYSVSLDGKETPLKYYNDGPFIVVNTIQLQFSLRISDDILCIFNNPMF